MKFQSFLFACAAIALLASASYSQSLAITNSRIVTVSGPTIEKGTVVVRDGLIEAVGAEVKAPADAQVFDGTGLTVYPGFIDPLTNLGTPAPTPRVAGSPPASQAQQEQQRSNSNYPVGLRPEISIAEELRSGESQFEAHRNAGFTTAVTVGRSGIFLGQSAVINLAGENVADMLVKAPFAQHIAFNTVGGGQYPGSLLGTFSALRQMLLDARRLDLLNKQYAANPRGLRRPPADRSLEALIPVLEGRTPLIFNANRENEIVRALDLIDEFKVRGMIAGGQEAWKVADRLKMQNVPVLLSLNFPKRTAASSPDADPETLDLLRFRAETPKAAARLAAAGVTFAFYSGNVTNINDHYLNAGKAVAGGLSRDAAIRAMTLGPAELLGVADRVGSIEPGKIANITMIRGDLFGTDRFAKLVLIDGRVFEPKEPAAPRPGRGPGTGPAVATVGGNFSVTVDVPGQTVTGTLAMVQQGAVITGSLQTQLGTAAIRDGRVTAEGFTFSSTVDFGGSTIEILVKGSVTGNQVSGTIDSPQGVVPFSGTRNP